MLKKRSFWLIVGAVAAGVVGALGASSSVREAVARAPEAIACSVVRCE